MTAGRIEKLRAALEHVRTLSEASDSALADEIYVAADRALDEDEKARLCAPAEVAPRTVPLCPNPNHTEDCCK